MRRNHDLDAGLAVLSEAGIRDVVVARGSKHYQLRWQVHGQLRVKTISASPSDWRSSRNVRTEIRQQLRRDGLLPDHVPAPSKVVPNWRARVEAFVRQLRQIPVPHEKVAERDQVVAVLQELMDSDGPSAVVNGKEAITR
jgi:hypothetical protein